MHKGKYEAKKPVGGTQFGTTIHDSNAGKFRNKGIKTGKIPVNGVEDGMPHGATFIENSTHIDTPNADKPAPESKLLKAEKGLVRIKDHDTSCDLTASQESGNGGPTDRPYPLAKSYEKSGRKDRSEPKRAED